MATEFTYSISNDFVGGQVNTYHLHEAIVASAITANLLRVDTVADTLTIYFDTDLSAGEEIILDGGTSNPAGGLLAEHDSTKEESSILETETESANTTSTSFVQVPGMIATPSIPGTYSITFSGVMENDSRNRKTEVTIFIDGVEIAHTRRRSFKGSNFTQVSPFTCITQADLDGNQTVEGRWRVDNNSTGTISERSLYITPV